MSLITRDLNSTINYSKIVLVSASEESTGKNLCSFQKTRQLLVT
jgi:hypothetical protein